MDTTTATCLVFIFILFSYIFIFVIVFFCLFLLDPSLVEDVIGVRNQLNVQTMPQKHIQYTRGLSRGLLVAGSDLELHRIDIYIYLSVAVVAALRQGQYTELQSAGICQVAQTRFDSTDTGLYAYNLTFTNSSAGQQCWVLLTGQ